MKPVETRASVTFQQEQWLYLSFCAQTLNYQMKWREGKAEFDDRDGNEIEEGSCTGQSVRSGFESVYIRPFLCCSLECNKLNLVFTPASGVGFLLNTEL